MQTETKFKIKIRKELNAIPNSWWVKTQMLSVRGIPDFLGCVTGRFVALELKMDEAEALQSRAILQNYILAKIHGAGGYARFVTPDSSDHVIEYLTNFVGTDLG